MIDDIIKPYPGEDEFSFIKRKVYYIRELEPRIKYHQHSLPKRLVHAVPLTQDEIDEIDAFWSKFMSDELRDLLINKGYYSYYKRALSDHEHLSYYLPDLFYQAFIDEYFSNPQHTRPLDDKNLYDVFFYDVKRPRTLFRKVRNSYLDENYSVISMDKAIEKVLNTDEVVLKVAKFSCGGSGVKFWSSTRNDDKQILIDFLNESNNVICQEALKQHAELSRLNPSSVNTVRMMTLFFGDKAQVLSSVVRMGTNDSRVDNASSGGIVCGINPDGRLKNVAYDIPGNVYLKHPRGTEFESVTVPNFSQFIELAESLASRFSSASRQISWDFAVDETGTPALIEFNLTRGQLDFHQLCNGPIFGDMTEEVLKEVFANSYTLNSIIKSFQ